MPRKLGAVEQRMRQAMTVEESLVRLRQRVVLGSMAGAGSKGQVPREDVRVRVDA